MDWIWPPASSLTMDRGVNASLAESWRVSLCVRSLVWPPVPLIQASCCTFDDTRAFTVTSTGGRGVSVAPAERPDWRVSAECCVPAENTGSGAEYCIRVALWAPNSSLVLGKGVQAALTPAAVLFHQPGSGAPMP